MLRRAFFVRFEHLSLYHVISRVRAEYAPKRLRVESMMDLLYLAISFLFFGAMLAYVWGCFVLGRSEISLDRAGGRPAA